MIKYWCRWSDIADNKFPQIASFDVLLVKNSIRFLGWSVTLTGCKMYGKIILEKRESKNSFVGGMAIIF